MELQQSVAQEAEKKIELKKKVSPMIQLLDDTDITVIREVQKALFALGNSTIPFLRTALTSSNDNNQKRGIIDVIRLFQSVNVLKVQDYLKAPIVSDSITELEQCLIDLSSFGYPETNAEDFTAMLDNAALEVHQRYIKNAETNYITLTMALNDIFFHRLGFCGDDRHYFHPDSTYIHTLISQKKGIPISLCVLYLLIAERCGIEMYGVGLPLHFLAYNCDAEMYVDVYNYGIMLTIEDCASFVRKAGLEFNESMVNRASVKSMIERMVRNLIIAHEKYGDIWEAEQLRNILIKKDKPITL